MMQIFISTEVQVLNELRINVEIYELGRSEARCLFSFISEYYLC